MRRHARLSRWLDAFDAALRADVREKRRDGRAKLTLAIALLLALVSSLVTWTEARDTQRDRTTAHTAERDRWLDQGKRGPHQAAHYGVYAFKPLSPLAAVDPGIERYVGSSVWLEAHWQNNFVHRPSAVESGAARHVRLTPAFVLQIVTPLAIIFLGFGAIANDRVSGTWRQLRLSGAPLSAIAAARGGALLLAACIVALPMLVSALFAHSAIDDAHAVRDGGLRALAFGATYLLYFGVWIALTLCVSALARTPRGALGVLLGLWVLATVLAPRFALDLADRAAPLPAAHAFHTAVALALGDPHDRAETERYKEALLTQHGVTDVKQLPFNWSGISLQRGEERANGIFDRHYGALHGAYAKQDRWFQRLGWVSPAIGVLALSSHFSASDLAHHTQFVHSAEQQRRLIQRVLNERIAERPDVDGRRYEGDRELWARIPPFRFQFDPITSRTALGPAVWALLAWLSLAGVTALWAVSRAR